MYEFTETDVAIDYGNNICNHIYILNDFLGNVDMGSIFGCTLCLNYYDNICSSQTVPYL